LVLLLVIIRLFIGISLSVVEGMVGGLS